METVPITPAAVPEFVHEISSFLVRCQKTGTELAFWRAKAQSQQIGLWADALLRLCHHPTYFQEPVSQTEHHREAFELLYANLSALAGQVPFESRVNLLHRSLIPVYQQVYVLQNLTASILCRLRYREHANQELSLQAGSFLDVETRRGLRDRLREIAPSWDRKEWNLYDEF
jgi:hypothetical protein